MRIATMEDYSIVLNMAKKFVNSIDYGKYSNEAKMEAIVRDFLTSDGKVCILYADIGMIAGLVNPFVFGDDLVATEIAWWIEPEHRGNHVGVDLLNAFEGWAKDVGCSLVTMISLDDRLGAYYERTGYKLYERAYMKDIR